MADDQNGDRTVIRPMPGGGQRASSPKPAVHPAQIPAAVNAPPAPISPPPSPVVASPSPSLQTHARPTVPLGDQPLSDIVPLAGQNPLLDASVASLILIQKLRSSMEHGDVEGLHRQVVKQVSEFEARANAAEISGEVVNAARYCLCTALDEAVLSTPWGSNSVWREQSLLVTFHKETWGGEKVFQILENVAQDPQRNLYLLEFLYVIICLGFEGKYRVMERGEARLEELRMTLFERLRPFRGEFERELSPNWRGIGGGRRAAARSVPLWVVGALAGAVIVTSYTAMRFVLEDSADPVYEKLQIIEKR